MGSRGRITAATVTQGRCYDARRMSENTERLQKLRERVLAAKEFL
jgi:hypothetical protein